MQHAACHCAAECSVSEGKPRSIVLRERGCRRTPDCELQRWQANINTDQRADMRFELAIEKSDAAAEIQHGQALSIFRGGSERLQDEARLFASQLLDRDAGRVVHGSRIVLCVLIKFHQVFGLSWSPVSS